MDDLTQYNFEFNDWGFPENPYYHPEQCGLVIVAEIELSEPGYSFDTRIVWKAQNGKLYTAHDSGCSCPTPFEDFKKLSDLTLVNAGILDAIKAELRGSDYVTPDKAQEFFYKIRDAAFS